MDSVAYDVLKEHTVSAQYPLLHVLVGNRLDPTTEKVIHKLHFLTDGDYLPGIVFVDFCNENSSILVHLLRQIMYCLRLDLFDDTQVLLVHKIVDLMWCLTFFVSPYRLQLWDVTSLDKNLIAVCERIIVSALVFSGLLDILLRRNLCTSTEGI